jgi:hypothetical protein
VLLAGAACNSCARLRRGPPSVSLMASHCFGRWQGGGAASAGGDSCPGRRRPHDPLLFFDSECDGGSAAEVSDLSEMMAALPPRRKASFYLCIYLFASFLIAET